MARACRAGCSVRFSIPDSARRHAVGVWAWAVRRIVREYHGGQIVIQRSEEGVGTTFRVTLPVDSAG